MSVTPSGSLSEPVNNLRTMLSNCATWQDWTGSETAEEAIASIFPFAVAAADLTSYPAAIVFLGDNFRLSSLAATGVYLPNGTLGILFIGEVPTEYASSHSDAMYDFCNKAGAIAQELHALNGQPLTIREISAVYGPERADATERNSIGDVIEMGLEIAWGLA